MSQSQFAAAVLDPDLPMPAGLIGPDGAPSPRRFAVYRNNVTLSLIRVLEAGFPCIQKLVGEAFFRAMAGEFVRSNPPKTRIMMLYGADFPGFLARFPPVAHLGYLADVARLEQTRRESYHAGDCAPFGPAELASVPLEVLSLVPLRLSPTLRVIWSDWPVLSIWRANMAGGPNPRMGAEEAMITRPQMDPVIVPLPSGGAAVLAALAAGQGLSLAALAGGTDFDLVGFLQILISGGAIAGIGDINPTAI
jgi:hypothetical protein